MGDATPEATEAQTGGRKLVDWSIITLATLAVITALAVARVFLVPVILAFLLALVFSPLCRWMARRGVPQPVSAAGIVGLLLVGIVFLSTSLAVPVSTWIDDAPRITREVERKLRSFAGIAEAVAKASEQVDKVTKPSTGDGNDPVEVVVQQPGTLSVIAFSAPLIAAQTAFVLILLYFVLASGTLFYERLVGVMPTFADKRRAIAIAYDIEREVSRYLLSITVINAGLGVAVAIAFTFLDMPQPLLFGLLAFAFNYVPFIGALIGTALSFAVALISMDTATEALFIAAVFWALTAIEGQFVTPWLVGRQLQLNTVVILVAVSFWAWLWSIMGMLMAVPLLVTLRVFCRHIPHLSSLEAFLSARDAATDR
jgi:predicted PurR-regulated permease PerM